MSFFRKKKKKKKKGEFLFPLQTYWIRNSEGSGRRPLSKQVLRDSLHLHLRRWELDYKESWEPKNGCFWTVVLEKTLESPLDCKEIQPVHSKGDQSWEFTGRIDVKAETPVLWPPHVKSWLIGKDSDAGRDWGQEKGRTEDEMAGWHHRLQGREFEWTQEVGDRQRGLVCCDSWGCKKSDMNERLNWTELNAKLVLFIFRTWETCQKRESRRIRIAYSNYRSRVKNDISIAEGNLTFVGQHLYSSPKKLEWQKLYNKITL